MGEGIKARLDERSKDWIKELSHVLWAYRTMIKSSNGETPFSLTYGTKVVIPAEVGMPTLRTAEVDLTKNDKVLEINLDLIEEKREQAVIQEAKSKAKMEKYYNSKKLKAFSWSWDELAVRVGSFPSNPSLPLGLQHSQPLMGSSGCVIVNREGL
ncbi:reverse transcriptase domain-containing protein [Tanacetum coccineum]